MAPSSCPGSVNINVDQRVRKVSRDRCFTLLVKKVRNVREGPNPRV